VAYPKVDDSAFTEREGIIAVEIAVNQARCIWRETLARDVGIDGQVEFVDPERNATGRIVALQVKSGRSHFKAATQTDIPYSPPERHKNYWREFPLPVILVLHDPAAGVSYWTDARAQLRLGSGPVRVPKNQVFDAEGVLSALQAGGPLPGAPLSSRELVALMLKDTEPLSRCDLSFFDLFVQGLTDPASWSVYFSMDLYFDVAQTKQALLEVDDAGLTIGPESYAFIDRYIAFLIGYDLARVDFDAFKRLEQKAQMVGRVLAPLTARGIALTEYIDERDEELPPEWPSRVVRDRPIQMLLLELPERTARIEELKRRL
jgi:hypothetical protein